RSLTPQKFAVAHIFLDKN
ncbi:hypothetical protein VCHC17A1_1213B, partial [Vibrio cholerae HC-17A1]